MTSFPAMPPSCAVTRHCGYRILVNFREACGISDCNGVLFSRDAPRGDETLLMCKITQTLFSVYQSVESCPSPDKLKIGQNREKVHEPVQLRWPILQPKQLNNHLIAADIAYSKRDSLPWAVGYAGIELELMGKEPEALGMVVNSREPCQAIMTYQAVSP